MVMQHVAKNVYAAHATMASQTVILQRQSHSRPALLADPFCRHRSRRFVYARTIKGMRAVLQRVKHASVMVRRRLEHDRAGVRCITL
jgi:hypothetical protein